MKQNTPLIRKAMEIAYEAHREQSDECGVPYIFHPAYIAAQMDTEDEIVVALLHDVLEKTPLTSEELKAKAIPRHILDMLEKMLPRKNIYYDIWLQKYPAAVKVKFAELRHDSDPSRYTKLPPEERKKHLEKVERSIKWLKKDAAEREAFLRAAESKPYEMFQLGIELYHGFAGAPDKRRAFALMSRAMEMGLDREESQDDCPAGYEYGELVATRYIAKMLMEDDDGILSTRTEPFWFEKPLGSAKDVEQILMYITGRGAERDLKKACYIASVIANHLSFGDRSNMYADELFFLLDDAYKNEYGLDLPVWYYW